jgi:hypothetical protein
MWSRGFGCLAAILLLVGKDTQPKGFSLSLSRGLLSGVGGSLFPRNCRPRTAGARVKGSLRVADAEGALDAHGDGHAKPFVPSRWPTTPGTQTALRENQFEMVDLPKHFRQSACFLLTESGECSLQLLSEGDRLHKWMYKPLGCWLHPILHDRIGTPSFRVDDAESDPYRTSTYPGFIEFTNCGRTVAGGKPAHAVLQEELEYVRDLVGEENLPPALAEWLNVDPGH